MHNVFTHTILKPKYSIMEINGKSKNEKTKSKIQFPRVSHVRVQRTRHNTTLWEAVTTLCRVVSDSDAGSTHRHSTASCCSWHTDVGGVACGLFGVEAEVAPTPNKSHNRIEQSRLPLTSTPRPRRSPRQDTESLCPTSVTHVHSNLSLEMPPRFRRDGRDRERQSLTTLSSPPLIIASLESRSQACRHRTLPWWPVRVAVQDPEVLHT